MLVGYARVPAPDPGCERIFTDRCSCRQNERPQLDAELGLLRPKDALVVWRFDRLARSAPDMLALAAELRRRACELVSLSEAIDTSSPGGNAVFAVMAALARLEVDLRGPERARESHRRHVSAACRSGHRDNQPLPGTCQHRDHQPLSGAGSGGEARRC